MRRLPWRHSRAIRPFRMVLPLLCTLVLMGATPPPVPYAPKPKSRTTTKPKPPRPPMVRLQVKKFWWTSSTDLLTRQAKKEEPSTLSNKLVLRTGKLSSLCKPGKQTGKKQSLLTKLCQQNQRKSDFDRTFRKAFLQQPSTSMQDWHRLAARWLKVHPLASVQLKLQPRTQTQVIKLPKVGLAKLRLKSPAKSLYPRLPTKPFRLEWSPKILSKKKQQGTSTLPSSFLKPLQLEPYLQPPPTFPMDDEPEWPPQPPQSWPVDWPTKEPNDLPSWNYRWEKQRKLSDTKLIELEAKARVLWERKQFASSIKLYKQLLAVRPWHTPTLHKMARWYAWRKNYKAAKQAYQDILLYNPGSPDAHRGLGDINFWSEQYKDAIRWYKIYLQTRPDAMIIWRNLGRAAAKIGDDSTAKTAYKKILKKKPSDMEALLYLSPKPRFSINAFTHQSFASNTLRQEYHFALGVRLLRKLWAVAEADFRIRFHPSLTFADAFFSGALYWTPLAWDKLTLSLQMGGSPFSTIAPQFYLNFESSVHLHWVEFHAGYRYFLFPIRRSHLVSPGVTVHLAPVHIHLRYFLSLSELEGLPLVARHSFYGYIRWQAQPWLGLLAGGGGGNALDFLSDYVRPFLDQGVASQNFTEFTFHIRLGSQFRIAFRQHLMINYTYSRERFRQSENQDPIDADLHTATLGYRIRF